ncbi:YagK/YfjJ domain-containing protein [Aliarcobacter skirrowii]|uniref:YagK/YfjJ domain-containing protein n=1 Tax=Aliarcobacter skirrowii TaxID=28200 RepID=UPI0029BBB6E8|nr:inovirus-type Gp2 protein [Aliarcobacter skirrowii]MDX4037855.1 inovirus-type Gp2 protein [Aliarcobacter skirrowii]
MSNNTFNRRKKSSEKYIDAILANNSKVCGVRVDLKYKQEFAKDVSLDVINKDLKRMLDNRRNNKTIFGNNLGYIIKKEVSNNGNLHLHALFLEDGNKVQKAAFKADQIGKYWNDSITKGKGCYENCNKNKYEKNGIGMIDYTDKDKINNLKEHVVSYFYKTDEQSIDEIKTNPKDRAIVRGTIPKPKSKAGRPRSKGNVKEDTNNLS